MYPLLKLPPLSLYVHVPWCVRKCPYCDFNSHQLTGDAPELAYLDALLADLQQDLPQIQGRPLTSIFIGGGTPSLLSAHFYQALFTRLQAVLKLSPECEITLEANPSSFEYARFAAYRQLGINRLSLGVQSFAPEHLHILGRVHDRAQALAAIEQAQKAGFDRINVDLMHGLPQQTPQQALADLRIPLSFGIRHISWYQLTLEPNTHFYHQPPRLPDEDTLADIQEAGQALLQECGLHQYEVSAFAYPGQEARHNLNYWQFGDYLGIGAGAHSKCTYPDGHIVRRWKTRQPQAYLQHQADGRFCAGEQSITTEERPFEFLMNALRLTQGVPSQYFAQRTGIPLSQIQPVLDQLAGQGLMRTDPEILATTPLGLRYLNQVLEHFL
ncbi:oxygen-independent coproporphyrinogen-3 oxidase [Allopseudospirillum japonicum]|uniref:Heme chaperone HemW n=1 Tax=Allopseudospirillum japonicum TaxID=64971 RepID=A0A1H6R0M2_9GAMM|nr:radical SAM family heme chaperone HemW [Allopseudospirillum japonicum]SEI49439.1 oxygen-independent coproporphyrinogen-3 oxidase [Allopseudospirillum japonicum]